MELRPYQRKAIDDARLLVARGANRVLLIAPTGSGKTVQASAIITGAVSKGSRSLFLAHRRELIAQTSDKLNRFGVPHGIIMAGAGQALHEPVQVASVQTLIRRTSQLTRPFDVIFIDEAHHLTTENTYAKLLAWQPNAKVIGLTATPWRLDGKGLGDLFDAHVVVSTPRQLRDEGYLVPAGGWEYEGIDTSGARVRNGDFVANDLEEQATSKRIVGDVVEEYQRWAAGKRAVFFAVNVAHSQTMAAAFTAAGISAEHVDGTMGAAERDAIIARVRSGQTLVVCNCNVLSEGFDLPELEVCILGRPSLSTSLVLQQIGRVLRPAPGKEMARIHDHAGCLAAHGHPYAERDYTPTRSANVSRSEAESSTVRRARLCPSCRSVLARQVCDACGWQMTPHEMRIEQEEAAARREIGSDGRAKAGRTDSDIERRRRWERKYAADDAWKREFLARMVAKHGRAKGVHVYWWFSGKTERPPRAWLSELEEVA